MIVVSVRVQQDDRQLGKLGDNFLEVADSHDGVEEQSPLLADDQVSTLNRWKADPQLQSCISKLQQSLNIPFGFAVLLHRDAVVTITKFPVNSFAFA
jgi:hypothetical protein